MSEAKQKVIRTLRIVVEETDRGVCRLVDDEGNDYVRVGKTDAFVYFPSGGAYDESEHSSCGMVISLPDEENLPVCPDCGHAHGNKAMYSAMLCSALFVPVPEFEQIAQQLVAAFDARMELVTPGWGETVH